MAAPQKRAYKRSWKNYLLNKRYQLRFTLLMTGLSAVLMGLLGWWVMREAHNATEVAINNALGVKCKEPDLGALTAANLGASGAAPSGVVDQVTGMHPVAPDQGAAAAKTKTKEKANSGKAGKGKAAAAKKEKANGGKAGKAGKGKAATTPASSGSAGATAVGAAAAPPELHPQVTIDESTMEPVMPPDLVKNVVVYETCLMDQDIQIASLHRGERTILWVLVSTGILLLIGITLYGIKMTHRVAGPLYKVTLYFAKLRDGKYDTVYNLRKGDQLVAFYEHFKAAHDGLRSMQVDDLAVLKEVIAAADATDLASRSPELGAALDELRDAVKRKEDSLV